MYIKDFCLRNNLAFYREFRKLTQTQLANILGVSRNTISSIEIGKHYPNAYLVARLCVVLECSFSDLFYFNT